MKRIGIECENLEDPKSRWGVGQVTLNLLQEYAKNLEWQKEYRFYLYFKKSIPDDEVLKNPIFNKRVMGFPSFNIFYHFPSEQQRLNFIFGRLFLRHKFQFIALKRTVIFLLEQQTSVNALKIVTAILNCIHVKFDDS